MVSLECTLGVNQLITVYHFSLLCEMDESPSRFWIRRTSDEEKTCIINFVPKSTVYKNKWVIQLFRESVDLWILYPNLETFGYNIQIFKDFHQVFHWVSTHMHVTWYTSSDL